VRLPFGLAKSFGNLERRRKMVFATGFLWTFGIVDLAMDYLFLGVEYIAHHAAIYVAVVGIAVIWTLVTLVRVVYGKEK
jgi:hypothetical protein